MTTLTETQFVSRYLTNFFAEATEEEITGVISEINPAIIQVMSTLIEHDVSIKEIVETTSLQIQKLETQVTTKDNQIKILKQELSKQSTPSITQEPILEEETNLVKMEQLKILRSATYNARLYLIFQEICRRYRVVNDPVSLRRVHREMGQVRMIHAFNPSTRSPRESHLTQLINLLFGIKKFGRELTATPTELGLEIYDLGLEYYSEEKTEIRFKALKQNGELSSTKLKLLKTICSSPTPVNNTSKHKINLAQMCGIHKDNISKYLVDLVKLGFLERYPTELVNNRFTFRCCVRQYLM
ncbi:MAG: hypothetical protein GPJ54_16605 [Candidatus Heimdallarchaeota archaeon]|nr:hypothetical protein [Candidatus Heimdallarchaeota archaeon]